jgi:hypothetical protein
MKLDYQCDTCWDTQSNETMESFVCECGGTMRLIRGVAMTPPPFNSGWCDTLKCEVTSWKDQAKKAREHRSRSHPQGFVFAQDDKRWLKELKNIRRYKGDYMKSELPGFHTSEIKKPYNSERPDIHRTGKRVYSFAK